jgi:ribosomal protein S18 acetylase RimI-like enzyme
VPPAVSVLAPAFAHDPVISYMLNNLTRAARLAYLPAYFRALLTAATLNGASISEADGWASCAVVMPPGADVGNPWTLVPAGLVGILWTLGVRGCWKMIGEFEGVTGRAREREMGRGGRYYYVFFIGTAEEGRGRGLASRLMEEVKEGAGREGMPVWLEATTERSRNLYARLGFEDLGEIVLGKGQVGADGERKKGGEGVRIWPMIWRPDSAKS